MTTPPASPASWPPLPGTAAIGPALLERVAAGLRTEGFVVLDEAVPGVVADRLSNLAGDVDGDLFRPAAIGRDGDLTVRSDVRGDRIIWLDPSASEPDWRAPVNWYFAWLESLRVGLNRSLFLGLFDVEAHLAWYPPGARYRVHVDAFRPQTAPRPGPDPNRRLSLILYLNADWQPGDGGELVLYAPSADEDDPLDTASGVVAIVPPRLGTLVVFLSDEFPHEVQPTVTHRMSIAGWFRDRPTLPGAIAG